ncbi:MAG: PrgI family protein [Candidatus Saccharimonadales bacterium]
MATYKVLQDIEAEDKFVGPLTLKQFVLAGVTLVSGYLSIYFLTNSHHIWFFDIILVPIMLVSGFLAFPWGRDQPTEVWLLAKLRFMLKPRQRIWDQSGMQELVTITAPKHIEQQYTSNNLSQIEVRSRLKALANTIDSRGWAVKNVNVNLYAEPGYGSVTLPSSDRLVAPSSLAQPGPAVDVQASDDMLDERNNPTAQHLNQMIEASSQAHRQEALQGIQDIRDHKKPTKKADRNDSKKSADEPPADYWFMNQPAAGKLPKDYATFSPTTVLPGQDNAAAATPAAPLTADEQTLLSKAHQQADELPAAYGRTPVIEPLGSKHKSRAKHAPGHQAASKQGKHSKSKTTVKSDTPASGQAMTQTPDPAILNLANNDDLSVATIARQANKKPGPEPPKGEVVISLR